MHLLTRMIASAVAPAIEGLVGRLLHRRPGGAERVVVFNSEIVTSAALAVLFLAAVVLSYFAMPARTPSDGHAGHLSAQVVCLGPGQGSTLCQYGNAPIGTLAGAD